MPQPPVQDYAATCRAIADDIERIRGGYAQFVEFRASAARQSDCTMSYAFHTHKPTSRGGWSSAVPQPDPDGIWFYLGVYDPNGPDAMSQINTQPMVPNWWIGDRRVMFLILEGERTKLAADAILAILHRHGMITK